MSTLTASAERLIADSPEHLYELVADFAEHHPHILPKAFSDFSVESGGVGVGTVTASTFRMGGRTDRIRTRVVCAEPSRIIEEIVLGRSMTTSFTFRPDVSGTRVAIDTTWRPAGGLNGFLERRFAPRMLSRIYAEELERLERYAAAQRAAEPAGSGAAAAVSAAA
jgi:ribosome-associated toxin RatA of RatAB toxin-antitoxin module